MRRSRSGDIAGSPDNQGLPADSQGSVGRRRTLSSTSRRMSLKMGFGKRSNSSSALETGHLPDPVEPEALEAPPPVPAVPDDLSRYPGMQNLQVQDDSNVASVPGSGRSRRFRKPSQTTTIDTAKTLNGQTPVVPRARNGKIDEAHEEDGEEEGEVDGEKTEDEQQDGKDTSYVRAATAAVASAGAATVGAVAALAPALSGNSAQQQQIEKVATNGARPEQQPANDAAEYSDDSSSEEFFFDAELADIAEDSEGEDEPQSPTRRKVVTGASMAPRSASPEPLSPVKEKKMSKPRGTAGATRRAGSEETPAPPAASSRKDGGPAATAQAKEGLPTSVLNKAAAVSKLTIDDVRQTTPELREDLKTMRKALDLFLNSKMIEAEQIAERHADKQLYYALGLALIATIKGFMVCNSSGQASLNSCTDPFYRCISHFLIKNKTFEPQDLAVAISYAKDSLSIAQLLRKPSSSVANFGRFVRGIGQSPSGLASMDDVQKHAELVYAESLLLKAVVGSKSFSALLGLKHARTSLLRTILITSRACDLTGIHVWLDSHLQR